MDDLILYQPTQMVFVSISKSICIIEQCIMASSQEKLGLYQISIIFLTIKMKM